MQGLPLLRRAYPNHWVFADHQLFADTTGEFDLHGKWTEWEHLAVLVHDDVLQHKVNSKMLNCTFALPAYTPPRTLRELAAGIEASWAVNEMSSVDVADPIQAMAHARRQVSANSTGWRLVHRLTLLDTDAHDARSRRVAVCESRLAVLCRSWTRPRHKMRGAGRLWRLGSFCKR